MKSPFLQVLAAAGVGAWIRVSHEQRPFNEGMFYSFSQDATGEAGQVEHTPDNPDLFVPVIYTVAGNTLTANFASPHNLITGDAVQLNNTNFPSTPGLAFPFTYDGSYTVASTPTDNQLTLAVAGGGPATSPPTARAALCRVFADTAMVGLTTTRKYASNTTPVLATRLHMTALTTGTAFLEIVQGHDRG